MNLLTEEVRKKIPLVLSYARKNRLSIELLEDDNLEEIAAKRFDHQVIQLDPQIGFIYSEGTNDEGLLVRVLSVHLPLEMLVVDIREVLKAFQFRNAGPSEMPFERGGLQYRPNFDTGGICISFREKILPTDEIPN